MKGFIMEQPASRPPLPQGSIAHATKMEIGQRLLYEEARLGFTQSEIANQVNCSRRTWHGYLAGETCPDSVMLSKLDGLGFDVLYVVTGRREQQ